MRTIFKILIGSSLAILGLSLLFFFTQQTLAGRFLVIKTGLSVSSILAFAALILFTFSLVTYRKNYSNEEKIREAARKAGEYLLERAKGKLSNFSERTRQKLYRLITELENELNVPYHKIRSIVEEEWENIRVERFQGRTLAEISRYRLR
jgi:hypothetical protein